MIEGLFIYSVNFTDNDTELFVIKHQNVAYNLKFNVQKNIPKSLDPTICGIDFTPPWFIVNSIDGTPLLIIDSNGNLYINSSSIRQDLETSVSTTWKNAFVVVVEGYYYWGFNKTKAELWGHIVESSNPSYNSADLAIVNRSNSAVLAVFDSDTGNIIIRGKAAYQGAQAGCPSDGWYCKDSTTREYRNYYCDAFSGTCKYAVTRSETCSVSSTDCLSLGCSRYVCSTCKSGSCTKFCSSSYASGAVCTLCGIIQ